MASPFPLQYFLLARAILGQVLFGPCKAWRNRILFAAVVRLCQGGWTGSAPFSTFARFPRPSRGLLKLFFGALLGRPGCS